VNNALFSLEFPDISYTFNASASSVYVIKIIYFDFDVVPENYTITISGLNTSQSFPFGSLWLKANDGATESGGNLTGWTDKTGTNTFTVHGSVGYVTNSINFNPVVSINNTQSNTQLPNVYLSGNTAITYVDGFAVMRKTDPNCGTLVGSSVHQTNYGVAVFSGESDAGMWVGNGVNNSYQHFTNSNVSTGNVALVNLNVSLASSPYATGRLNGLNQTMSAGSAGDFAGINFVPWIGGTNNNASADGWKHFKGEAAEIMLYPNSVSATDRLKIESYLAIKYGITLDQSVTNYVASDGTTVLWNNISYWNDVFGIGNDTGSELSQTSSNSANTGSGDGTGQSGKGNIVLSNASSLDDGDFLMVGHDNAALSAQYTDIPSSVKQARIAREWKAEHTGDVGTVNLTFELDGISLPGTIGTATNDFNILIDSDGDGDFSNATASNPSTVNGTLLTFNGLTIPDGAVFTFSFQLTKTWDGSESTAWATGDNWAQGTASDASGFDHVIIPDVTNDPLIASGIAADCKDLTVQSGAALTIASGGSLITLGTITNNGTITMNRDLSIGAWHLISIPTTGITANTFLTDYLQVWNETTHAWEEIIDPATVLNANQGYSLWSTNPGPASYTFTGTPLTGNQSQAVTFTEYSSDPNAFEGANLLGNPYPSSLDWSGLDDTWGAIYYWDQSANGGLGDYVEWNNGVGSGSQYVPPMQGFFIVTTANGTFSLNNANRTHSGATAFYKSGISNGLVLEAKSGNNTDELFIVFNAATTNEFDLPHDALKFTSGLDGISQLYSFAGDRKLAIDVRPEGESIQLGFENNQSGIYSIGIKESDVENAWLEDIEAGAAHDLRNGSYQFAWDPATGNEKRFVLHFTALGVEDPVALESDVSIYAVNRDIHILSEQTGKVMVTDLAGRVLADREFSGNTTVALPGNIHPGVYLVVVTTGANVTTEKVFVR
jgi:hypothetical protein